ncbi:BPSS1780 family membrane protein [Massilia endophytica]|uniref:BPSS1780 family membrane protein n=1 Tax=Massilia endophytica TaxID=2899220 RepID=UPI001E57832E|nr:BPSS1780 family membrane protein [Massilia endophytica]UGQ47104.1 hypothetical protein LSQ66_01085 [Massilia endophytica]
MNKLPAITGWQWVKQGFSLFRQQPGGLSTLFLGYMFIMLFFGLIPVLGQLLPVILVPVFSVAFMRACAFIDYKRRIVPALLVSGFQKPAFPQLFALGMLYLAVAALAVGLSALVDDGMFIQLLTGRVQANSPELRGSNIGSAILLAVLVYLPGAMGFAFAAPLIYWQKMSLGKAIFFSFFSVLRSIKAFAVFAASWFGMTVLASQLILLIFGRNQFAMTLMMPMSVILTVVLHCSFYAAYRQIFGQPEAEAPAALVQPETPKE